MGDVAMSGKKQDPWGRAPGWLRALRMLARMTYVSRHLPARLVWEIGALTAHGAAWAVIARAEQEALQRTGHADALRLTPYLHEAAAVVDLGIGVGRVVQFVAPQVRELWGVDISWAMLWQARRRLRGYSNVRLVRCDLTCPRLPPQRFDLAYSFLVFQHLEKEDALLAMEQAWKALRPGGALFLQLPDLASPVVRQWLADSAHDRRWRSAARVRPWTCEKARIFLEMAGFDIEQIESDAPSGPNLYVLARRRPRSPSPTAPDGGGLPGAAHEGGGKGDSGTARGPGRTAT